MTVAVIGAGISGLMAAHSLHACGLEVKVIDKARGPGGRTSTRRHEAPRGRHAQSKRYAFDHGAQYFTARDPRFRRYVDAWLTEGIVEHWGGRISVVESGHVKIKENGPARFVGVPGMSAIARNLVCDLDVVYRTQIGSVVRHDKAWCLATVEGTDLGDFDAVIVATPPAQAAPLLAAASQLERQARTVAMRPCWAMMVVFPQELELPFDGAFVERSPLSWIARNSSKPGRPEADSWVLHGSPEWSARYLEVDADEVVHRLLDAFFEAVGLDPRAPVFVRAHRWRYSIAQSPLDVGCLWHGDLRIGACGDWCAGSRVEGAFLSGLAVAGRVLDATGESP